MSARNFHSVSMVAGIAATALGCYMVSLRVAAERASLEQVETRIVLAQRDIRSLQTEVGTRGRLAQLEKWNASVLALSAPAANQFLQGSFQLATLARPHDKIVDPSAPVVLASAPRPERVNPAETSDSAGADPVGTPSQMMHVASYKTSVPVAARGQAPPSDVAVARPAKKAAQVLPPVASVPLKAAKPAAKAVSPALDKLMPLQTVKVAAKPVKVAAVPTAVAAKDVKAKQ